MLNSTLVTKRDIDKIMTIDLLQIFNKEMSKWKYQNI